MQLRTRNLKRINDSEARAGLASEFMATVGTLGLQNPEVAALLGACPESVRGWRSGNVVPGQEAARRMLAILESGAWPEAVAPPEENTR